MLTAENKQKINEMVAEILEIDIDQMTEPSLFKEDHDADSLRAIEILACLEKEFVLEIPQKELAKMVNLSGNYNVVTSYWSK